MLVILVHISFLYLVDIESDLNCSYNLCCHQKSLPSLIISETDYNTNYMCHTNHRKLQNFI